MKNLLLPVLLACLSVTISSYTPVEKKTVRPGIRALVFPVSGKKSNIGGFFGDYRNGGRTHKGVDIYAKKGTPVVAVCDGVITSVATEKLGGRTVRLRAEGHTWSAYYAHLDKQNVYVGQYVQKGEVLGTVGNTGNAKRKASHLHFGIYNWAGAVNPLPFVKNSKKLVIPTQVVNRSISGKSTKKRAIASSVVYHEPRETITKNSTHAPATRSASNPAVSPEYVWKKAFVYLDAKASYYVTKSFSVVRVEKGKYKVIGKWLNTNDEEYPHYIILENKKALYIYKDGTIVTDSGKEIGRVS